MFFSLSPGSRPIRGLAGEKLEGEVKRNASQTDTRHGADFERLALRHRASVSLHNCFMLLFLCCRPTRRALTLAVALGVFFIFFCLSFQLSIYSFRFLARQSSFVRRNTSFCLVDRLVFCVCVVACSPFSPFREAPSGNAKIIHANY